MRSCFRFRSFFRSLLLLFVGGILFVALGCGSEREPTASMIIDSAIAHHGGPILQRAVVSFNFRGDQYRVRHNQGEFHYRRSYPDSQDRKVVEGLTNDSTYRQISGELVPLSDLEKSSIKTTVNSVSYFALLPEPLNDPAVQPTYLGRDTISGAPYYRVKVTFQKEGGGEDWQDIFVYWFRSDDYAMDYLAYVYGLAPDEEAGTRFREAYNIRRVNGVRFADYKNYTVDTLSADQLATYPELLGRDAMRLVSRVEVDSVRVRRL